MQKISGLALLAVVSTAHAVACAGQNAPQDAGPEAAYRAYLTALRTKDDGELRRVIADDFMTLDRHNKLFHKEDELNQAKISASYTLIRPDEIHLLVIENTAVISALVTVEGTDLANKSFSRQVRDLATLVKRHGQWQVVADQSSSATGG